MCGDRHLAHDHATKNSALKFSSPARNMEMLDSAYSRKEKLIQRRGSRIVRLDGSRRVTHIPSWACMSWPPCPGRSARWFVLAFKLNRMMTCTHRELPLVAYERAFVPQCQWASQAAERDTLARLIPDLRPSPRLVSPGNHSHIALHYLNTLRKFCLYTPVRCGRCRAIWRHLATAGSGCFPPLVRPISPEGGAIRLLVIGLLVVLCAVTNGCRQTGPCSSPEPAAQSHGWGAETSQ